MRMFWSGVEDLGAGLLVLGTLLILIRNLFWVLPIIGEKMFSTEKWPTPDEALKLEPRWSKRLLRIAFSCLALGFVFFFMGTSMLRT